MIYTMIKRFYILLLAIVASVGMSFAQASIVSSGTKGGMSYTFYDNGLLEISGSGALPGRAFTNWDGGFGTSVKNIRFAEDCEVYGLGDMWFGCYTENSQLETVEINSVVPIMFSASSGEGIFYRQDGAVTLTITAPGIVDVEGEIIGNYGSPVNMILNLPATTVFEKKWFSGLENNFAVTIPTGAKGHIPAGYSFTNPHDQQDYDHFVEMGHEDDFWDMHSHLVEGVDYTLGVESTFVITAENASQIFGQATVSFQAPTQASNSEWVLWRKSDLKTFSDMSSGDQKVCKDVTVKVNNGVYNTDSGWGLHFESSGEDGVQFVAPEGKVFKRIVILNEYGTFSDPNWSYDGNYKKWSGSANTVGFVGNICGISLIEFEVEGSAPAVPAHEAVMNLINAIGTVELTAECKAKIDAARTAYDALSAADKDLVTNIATLTTAEAAFENVMDIWLSGDCDAILWKDTTLTIRKHAGEGNGAMADYTSYYGSNTAPWYNSHWYNPQPGDIVIKSVTIEEGVTRIGDYAFGWMSELKTITIPSSVTSIGEDAFYWSKAVDDIYLTADPSNLTWVLPYSADNQFKPEKATRCHVPADLLTAYQETFGTLNMTFVGDLDPITPLTPEQQQALDAAKGLINAIPSPVVYTPACKDAIDAARAAYDALTPDMLKQLVSNYATLTAAEATYANLKDVAEAEAKIAAIPQPVTLKLATRDSIESARAAYEALNADQKLLVSNYDVLTAAEATWAGLTNVAPAGALSGKYTINDGGDVIYFAHGNLQYTRENLDADWSTGTFRLAENQYDRIELVKTYPDAYCTDNYGDKTAVGLFGWGTWGEGKTPNLTSSDRTLYTWSTDFSGTLEGTSTWRTLTKDEWVYLLAHNNQSYATVHGVNGLLVAPDGKDIDGKSMENWVEINDEIWTTMQNDGYLFLPACGQRSQISGANITTGGQGEEVLYYSSTQYNDTYAYNIWYKLGSQTADDYSNKRQAFGIRLVSAGVNPLDQVQVVKGLIEAIPAEITLDAACVNAIQSARSGYNALDTDAKAILDAADVKKLTDAEQALKDLNQAEADEVIAKINAIPTPVELKLATRDSINNARAAYEALNAAQQALVSNYTKLTDAEAALASLNPGVPPATPLDSAQAVKGQIEAIREPLDPTEACGAEIAAALNAYDALSDAAKGALDAADVQKLNDAATQYPALEAIAAIDMIPAEITYDPMTKSYIEIAKAKYDALGDASKALVPEEKVNKLTNALEAWAILVAKIEHNVTYIGKDGELKNEKVALLHIPDPAPDFNGYEFVRWDVKAGDFLEEGLRVKAVYSPLITTNPVAYDTLVYNGTAQTLVIDGVAKEGHIEYRINDGEWSAELPKAPFAAAYVVYYKLVREGHEDYMAGSVNVTIAKAPVTYTAPTAYDTLVYNASNQTLIKAGQTNDGIFEYTFAPDNEESWNTELPQAKDAGTYSVYYRVKGDLNHLDSTAVDPIAVTIAKAELTATADNKAIIFGELAPQFTVTYAGWQGDDDASVLTGEIAYTTPYVRGNNVGEYTIKPSGVDAANYTITFVDGTLTVNRKSAESSDIMAAQLLDENLVYTNAVNKPTIFVKDTTLTLTEEKDYVLTFVGRGETEYTESATAPTHVGEYTAKIEFIGNYKDMLTVDFTISKAELTITADDKENIFGEEAPEFTVSYEGFLGTDTKDVLTGSQAYACEYVRGDNVGDYTIIPSGVDAHDYVITFVNGTLTVNRKSAKDADIVAAQLAGEALVYDAEVNRPTIVVTDTTLTLTEEKDYVLTFIGTANDASVYEESAVAPVKAGDYTAIVAFVGNYIDTLTVDFTVSKAPLTITADDKEMIYGDEHPEFTVSYDGFLGTDDNSVLLGTQGYSCVYAPGSYIGTYAITPKDVTAYDYAITFVNGTLTVNKAVVSISGAEAQCAKFADGHANAVVLQQGTLNGIKLNDPIAHVTTAAYSSADVAEHLTVTLFYELTGDAALLTNYDLQPTSEVFSTEGVIIEPMIPDDQPAEKEDEETEIEEGIEVYAYGYCDGSGYSLRYHLETGIPDQYKIDFADSRFTDVDWTNLEVKGPDGHIDILIPVDLPTGDYTMTVTFRDSRFVWLESKPFDVTFHVNLPETFITPLFNNTIALVDTCECFTDIQWYWRADASQLWQPIEGATGHYYHVEGKLTGEYFVQARMNGEPTYTCGQADMETLYGADKQQPKATVKAFPNPVVNTTTVTIENSENWNHSLRVVNLTGVEMFRTTFEGNETVVRMDGFVQGNYMISVDGIVVKVMKK